MKDKKSGNFKDKAGSFFDRVGQKAKKAFGKKPAKLEGYQMSSGGSDEPGWKRIATYALLTVLFIAVGGLAVFTIGIYGFKWDNSATDFAKKIVPYPAAVVNMRTIPINQVEAEAGHIEHFYQKSGGEEGNLPNLNVVKNQVLDRLIEDMVIASRSARYNVTVEDKEINQQFDQIVEENGGKEKVQSLLKDLYDISPAEFKDLVKKQLQREKLKQKFEDEIRKKLRARHILIKVSSSASKKAKKQAENEAKRVLKLVKKKDANFGKLAKKYSQDKTTRNEGGQLPWFGRGDMVESFEKTAFNLDVGQISKVVKTNFGYHIIRLDEERGTVEENFNDWLDSLKKSWLTWKFIQW